MRIEASLKVLLLFKGAFFLSIAIAGFFSFSYFDLLLPPQSFAARNGTGESTLFFIHRLSDSSITSAKKLR